MPDPEWVLLSLKGSTKGKGCKEDGDGCRLLKTKILHWNSVPIKNNYSEERKLRLDFAQIRTFYCIDAAQRKQ
jgi:hypothetical protein